MLMFIVPILIGLKMVDISLYDAFVIGKNSKSLMDVYLNSQLETWVVSKLLNRVQDGL